MLSDFRGSTFYAEGHLPSCKSYDTWLLLTSFQRTERDRNTGDARWPKRACRQSALWHSHKLCAKPQNRWDHNFQNN